MAQADAHAAELEAMDWLDARQAASLLRMTPEGVRAAVHRGEL
jgi:hypothetical protein